MTRGTVIYLFLSSTGSDCNTAHWAMSRINCLFRCIFSPSLAFPQSLFERGPGTVHVPVRFGYARSSCMTPLVRPLTLFSESPTAQPMLSQQKGKNLLLLLQHTFSSGYERRSLWYYQKLYFQARALSHILIAGWYASRLFPSVLDIRCHELSDSFALYLRGVFYKLFCFA